MRKDRDEFGKTDGFRELGGETIRQFAQDVLYPVCGREVKNHRLRAGDGLCGWLFVKCSLLRYYIWLRFTPFSIEFFEF